MKKKPEHDELLKNYDFSKGERGKYAKKYAKGTNLILLSPDVAKFFPDSKSVNEALRGLVKLAQKSTR